MLETCRRRRLLGPADRVVVALSGGPDSTALLASLCELRALGEVGEVLAVHVDHQLRPESGADAEASAELCRRLGVPVAIARVRVAAGNVQASARAARYRALREEAKRWGATRIATGHTQDDQAETVILRLIRGSGARGLAGIPPRRGPLVRPLIDRSRPEVLAYLRARGLAFVEDPTNATPRYLRNRVRNEVFPALRALSPRAGRSIARAADLLRSDERALSKRAAAVVAGARAEARALRSEPVAVRRRAVRLLWRSTSGSRRGLSSAHVEAVLRLLRRAGPGRATLPGGFEARCAYGVLEVRPAVAAAPALAPPVEIPGPGRYRLPGGGRLEVEAEAGSSVPWPLWLRRRRPGDRFRPAGGRGSKKLKAWLIDRKVPREERDRLLVVADGGSTVLCLPALDARADVPGLAVRLVVG